MENKTKGVIKEMSDDAVGEKIAEKDGIVVEKNVYGKFDLWCDYSKLSKSKYPNLTR